MIHDFRCIEISLWIYVRERAISENGVETGLLIRKRKLTFIIISCFSCLAIEAFSPVGSFVSLFFLLILLDLSQRVRYKLANKLNGATNLEILNRRQMAKN